MKSKRKVEKLYEKFRIRQKVLRTVLEELKQSFNKSSVTMKKLSNTSKIDSLLLIRKKLFAELEEESNEMPDADQSRLFGVAYGVKVKNIIEMQSG